MGTGIHGVVKKANMVDLLVVINKIQLAIQINNYVFTRCTLHYTAFISCSWKTILMNHDNSEPISVFVIYSEKKYVGISPENSKKE